jgi:hypothetical protein
MTDSSWRRHPRAAFALLGAAVTALAGAAQFYWFEIANDLLGLGVSYDTRPAWLRVAMTVIAWLPLIILGAVAVGRIRRGRVFRPLAYVAGALGVCALAMGELLLRPAVEDFWHRAAFDSAAWRQNDRPDTEWPARLTMADDLLERSLLRHAPRDSVERLLGPGDQTEYFREWDLVYQLGPERGLIRIDSEWLVVSFAADGRVRDARIVRD